MGERKVNMDTGDEEKAMKKLIKLRKIVDTIGGTVRANLLRRELDSLLVDAYRLLKNRDY